MMRLRHGLTTGLAMLSAICLCPAATPPAPAAATQAPLSLETFIYRAARSDTEFERILVEELALRYAADLRLPAGDLVLSLKQEYQTFIDQSRSAGATAVTLSKLFPGTATEVSASLEAEPGFDGGTQSEISFTVSQPIARNAFGRSTKLLERIVGLEVDVARHQVIEAYEDYLARITVAYHEWYEAHANLAIARSSCGENLKLLDNIKLRQQKQVARPIDVNKIELQVLAKQERVIELGQLYTNRLHTIQRIVRNDGRTTLVPEPPGRMEIDASFRESFDAFLSASRTFGILRLLEARSSLEVDREADDLLPSLALYVSYNARGDGHTLENRDDRLLLGVSVEWPFTRQVDTAEHEIARIDLRRAQLTRVNTRHRLHEDIKNLFYEIRKEKQLIDVAVTKIALALSILSDETENYSYGRVSLNDYIAAVNVLDSNRFSKVLHEARYRKLITEWLRLTDRLVTRKEILETHHVE